MPRRLSRRWTTWFASLSVGRSAGAGQRNLPRVSFLREAGSSGVNKGVKNDETTTAVKNNVKSDVKKGVKKGVRQRRA